MLRIKEQETCLNLQEHDEDDDNIYLLYVVCYPVAGVIL